ncbi:MAG: methyltransferase [Bryobacteraceae bacterium]
MTPEISSQPPQPQAVVMDIVFSFFRARTTQVFAELQIADDIAAGRVPAVGQRFLQACAAIGLLRSLQTGRFALTPVGEALRSDVHGSMRAFAAAVLGGGHYTAWGHLADSARTEACAFQKAFGEDVWTYFTKTNPVEGHLFNQAMSASSAMIVQTVLEHYDFPPTGTFVDVAGGNGNMLAAILKVRPEARGIVMDLPFAQEEAERNLAAQDVADRCQFVAGDFFQAVPEDGDLYTMKWILHDWPDDNAAAILQSIHKAMPGHAKLILVEAVVPETDDAMFERMMDLNMMVMCGGKERTEAEWRALLDANGFSLSRVVPMPGPVSLVEAVKK